MILDSIQQAQARGASSSDILNAIRQQNPNNPASQSISTALSRGAGPDAILNQIIQQNQSPAPSISQKIGGTILNLGKDLVSPFVTAGATALAAGQGASNLVVGGAAKLLGQNDFANQRFAAAKDIIDNGYNVPGFGQVKPVGSEVGTQPGGYWTAMKRMVGTGAGIASTVIGGEGAGDVAAQAGKGAIKGLIQKGATEGALAGATGGLSSIGNKNATVSGVVGNVALGAGLGGLLGGVASPLLSRITPEGRAALAGQMAEKQISKVSDMVSPTLSASERVAAISRGQGIAPTLFRASDISPSSYDTAVAKSVSDIVSPKKTLIENVQNVNNAISNEATSLVERLGKNNAIFNTKQLGAKLDSIEPPLMVQSDPALSRAYDLAKQKFMTFVNEQPKNMTGLLEARKNFDAWTQTAVPNLYSSEAQKPLQQALKDMRNGANEFIASKLPDNVGFQDSLRKQSLMFEARDNMAEKAAKNMGSGISQFVKTHPLAKTALKYGAVAAGGGVAGDLLKHAVGE